MSNRITITGHNEEDKLQFGGQETDIIDDCLYIPRGLQVSRDEGEDGSRVTINSRPSLELSNKLLELHTLQQTRQRKPKYACLNHHIGA